MLPSRRSSRLRLQTKTSTISRPDHSLRERVSMRCRAAACRVSIGSNGFEGRALTCFGVGILLVIA